jgi:PAP2 superfamily
MICLCMFYVQLSNVCFLTSKIKIIFAKALLIYKNLTEKSDLEVLLANDQKFLHLHCIEENHLNVFLLNYYTCYMNLTSLVTLILIMFFYAWKAASESKEPGVTTRQKLTPSLKNGSGFRELLLFIAFLLFQRWSRKIAIGDKDTAFENALWVVDLEKAWNIYYEVPIQQYFIQNELLMQFLNHAYMKMHIPITIIFFVWLFQKRKKHYLFVRNGFLVANIVTLFFYISFPCAPPRMFPELGFVDSLLEISNINLYEGWKSKVFNQYAAVPSMHAGNALLIGIVIYLLHEQKWIRILGIIYPVFVTFLIVVTGNHFFVDAILGWIIVLFPYPIMWGLEKMIPGLRMAFRGRHAMT